MTTWEPSTKAFKSQMCSVKRTIGDKDIGRFKLQQFKNYEVDVGMKVFYSKASSALQRAADSKDKVNLFMNFGWGLDGEGSAQEDGAANFALPFATLLAILAIFA